MVPVLVLMAGAGAARLVVPKIAAMLFKKGLAKPLSRGKETAPQGAAARVIEKVDDLPQPVLTKLRPPAPKRSKVPEQPSRSQAEMEMASLRSKKAYAARKKKGKTEKELKKEAETKIRQADRAEVKAQRKRAIQESKNRRDAEVARIKDKGREERAWRSKKKDLTSEDWAAIQKGRKAQRGKIETHERVAESPTAPSSQKGMQFGRKGETIKRKKGGKVFNGNEFIRSLYDN
jgi:hypothetical protein